LIEALAEGERQVHAKAERDPTVRITGTTTPAARTNRRRDSLAEIAPVLTASGAATAVSSVLLMFIWFCLFLIPGLGHQSSSTVADTKPNNRDQIHTTKSIFYSDQEDPKRYKHELYRKKLTQDL
jgi:hypothetical protein